MKKELPHFHIGNEYGGSQNWLTDLFMKIGGCATVTACDMAIYLKMYKGKDKLYPNDIENISRRDYNEFSKYMKTFLRPRISGIAKGYQVVKEIKEVGSGLNDNRSKLNYLLEKELKEFKILLVEHKDRLTRFGFNYIDILLKSHNKQIEVINLVDSDKEDLIQDFVSVITSFCARIYGQRRSKRKTEKLIKELEDESKENS